MKTAIAALMLATALSSSALAADHLFPEPSGFGGDAFMPEYDQQVVSVLKDAMDGDVVLRMIELPSFVPESAVWVQKVGGGYKIMTVTPQEMIWDYSTRHRGKIVIKPNGDLDASQALDLNLDDPRRMPLTKCEVEISPQTEAALEQVWEKALRQTRYGGDPQPGLDGSTYHFAMRKGREFMAGRVWSPDAHSSVGKLTRLGIAMRDYCRSRASGGEDAIRQQAVSLLRELP